MLVKNQAIVKEAGVAEQRFRKVPCGWVGDR